MKRTVFEFMLIAALLTVASAAFVLGLAGGMWPIAVVGFAIAVWVAWWAGLTWHEANGSPADATPTLGGLGSWVQCEQYAGRWQVTDVAFGESLRDGKRLVVELADIDTRHQQRQLVRL